ncbi:MAG: hypothetical protein AAGG38_11790, partial [Planctomycetota bacterium]
MSAVYKIALAAGASLLLVVIASLILSSNNQSADVDPDGDDAPAPPPLLADDHGADRPGGRIGFADTPEVQLPLDPPPEPVPSVSIGRQPYDDNDPLFGSVRDPRGAAANTPLGLPPAPDGQTDPRDPDPDPASAPPHPGPDDPPEPLDPEPSGVGLVSQEMHAAEITFSPVVR